MSIIIEDLQDWAERVVQELQDLCDEAQAAAGEPDGEGEMRVTRGMIEEYERIKKGLPLWQAALREGGDDDTDDETAMGRLGARGGS